MSTASFALLVALFEFLIGLPLIAFPAQTSAWLIRLTKEPVLYRLVGAFFLVLCALPLLEDPRVTLDLDGLIRLVAWWGAIKCLVSKVHGERPQSAQEVNAAVSDELDAVMQKCLQKQPERRYADALSLAEDLSRCLDGRKPLALLNRPPGKAQKKANSTGSFGDLTTLFRRAFSTKSKPNK